MAENPKGLDRLRRIVEEAEGRKVEVTLKLTPTRQEIELSVNGTGFIPEVAIHANDNFVTYRSIDDLAEALIDDLASAAVVAHASEIPAKTKRRRR